MGFRIALSHESEIPNLKSLPPVALRQGVITRLGEVGKITSKLSASKFGFLSTELWDVDLFMILPVSGNRRLSPSPFNAPSLSQRDKDRDFKFGNWFRREATGPIPKLNGCRHSLPPHA